MTVGRTASEKAGSTKRSQYEKPNRRQPASWSSSSSRSCGRQSRVESKHSLNRASPVLRERAARRWCQQSCCRYCRPVASASASASATGSCCSDAPELLLRRGSASAGEVRRESSSGRGRWRGSRPQLPLAVAAAAERSARRARRSGTRAPRASPPRGRRRALRHRAAAVRSSGSPTARRLRLPLGDRPRPRPRRQPETLSVGDRTTA